MGSFLSLFSTPPARVIMLGLDGAGKTTILYRQLGGKVETTIPTIGLNVENLTVGKVQFVVFDIGGSQRSRPLYAHYYKEASAIIFVVDSTNSESYYLDEIRGELHRVLADKDIRHVPLLILANKQDAPGAMEPGELGEKIYVNQMDTRPWHLQPASAVTGEGIEEGFRWVATTIGIKAGFREDDSHAPSALNTATGLREKH